MPRNRQSEKNQETDPNNDPAVLETHEQNEQGQQESDDSKNQQSQNWRQLEEKARKHEENEAKYKELAFSSIAQLAGYDPSKGITKRLISEYDGDPTPDAFARFAKNEGLEPQLQTGGSGQSSELEQGMETLQERSDNLRNNSQEGTSSTYQDELRKAQEEGRWSDVISLGVKQQLSQQLGS